MHWSWGIGELRRAEVFWPERRVKEEILERRTLSEGCLRRAWVRFRDVRRARRRVGSRIVAMWVFVVWWEKLVAKKVKVEDYLYLVSCSFLSVVFCCFSRVARTRWQCRFEIVAEEHKKLMWLPSYA
jgi:hypothetical protein